MVSKKEIYKSPARIPVVYRNKALMPMVWRRVGKYVKAGKAVKRKNKWGLIYLELLEKPSNFNTQIVTLGVDPGSSFDGLTVNSKKCHLLNLELIHTKDIKKRMAKKAMYRRTRRSRLWHRPIKNLHRTSKKLPPTIRSKVDFRKQIVKELTNFLPISKVFVEDVKFDHYNKKWGQYFSLVEQGKSEFYKFLEEELKLKLILKQGFETKKYRTKLFNGKDYKTSKKDAKSFFAHCLDSFALSCMQGDVEYRRDCCSETTFLKRNWMSRRELVRFKSKVKEAKYYFRFKKGGEKKIFPHFSKLKRIRVKINENQSSNHGPWKYLYTEPEETFKSFLSNYGGTIVKGNSRVKKESGVSKKKEIWGYKNILWEKIN